LRQIKRIIKLKKEEEKILKSLDYYRVKLAEYVLQTGVEGGGFSYGMQSKVNEEINISASPLFSWSKELDERTSVHVYNKKTNESFSIYSRKD
jgi:hypothetical protein